jgi:hypothetical protein
MLNCRAFARVLDHAICGILADKHACKTPHAFQLAIISLPCTFHGDMEEMNSYIPNAHLLAYQKQYTILLHTVTVKAPSPLHKISVPKFLDFTI